MHEIRPLKIGFFGLLGKVLQVFRNNPKKRNNEHTKSNTEHFEGHIDFDKKSDTNENYLKIVEYC